jgi:hypothetical protein
MQGRDTMKGRHAVGGRTGTAGKMRKGQSEPASNKVTTAAHGERSMKAPYVPDAKDTSLDAQNFIKEPPAPFKNRQTAAQMSTASAPAGATPGLEPNIRAGMSGSRAPAHPSAAPTGQGFPNQSAQIGGRRGFPPPARKAGMNVSGFTSKRNARFYGE